MNRKARVFGGFDLWGLCGRACLRGHPGLAVVIDLVSGYDPLSFEKVTLVGNPRISCVYAPRPGV